MSKIAIEDDWISQLCIDYQSILFDAYYFEHPVYKDSKQVNLQTKYY